MIYGVVTVFNTGFVKQGFSYHPELKNNPSDFNIFFALFALITAKEAAK